MDINFLLMVATWLPGAALPEIDFDPNHGEFSICQQCGTGRPALLGDLVTLDYVAFSASGREIANSSKRGLMYELVAGSDSDLLLPRLAVGMRLGQSKIVFTGLESPSAVYVKAFDVRRQSGS